MKAEDKLGRLHRLIHRFIADKLPIFEGPPAVAMEYVAWNIFNAINGEWEGLEAMAGESDD